MLETAACGHERSSHSTLLRSSVVNAAAQVGSPVSKMKVAHPSHQVPGGCCQVCGVQALTTTRPAFEAATSGTMMRVSLGALPGMLSAVRNTTCPRHGFWKEKLTILSTAVPSVLCSPKANASAVSGDHLKQNSCPRLSQYAKPCHTGELTQRDMSLIWT